MRGGGNAVNRRRATTTGIKAQQDENAEEMIKKAQAHGTATHV
jgi:hypothetical protein